MQDKKDKKEIYDDILKEDIIKRSLLGSQEHYD